MKKVNFVINGLTINGLVPTYEYDWLIVCSSLTKIHLIKDFFLS